MADVAWMVVSGEYSSYTVHAVFTDVALKDAYVAITTEAGQPAEIEEIPLNPTPQELADRMLSWSVVMDWNGANAQAFPRGEAQPAEYQKILPTWHGDWVVPSWRMTIPAPNAAAAIKAVNERRLIAIANGVQRESKP